MIPEGVPRKEDWRAAADHIADCVMAALDDAFAKKGMLPLLQDTRKGVHGAARGAAMAAFDLAARARIQGLDLNGALGMPGAVQEPAFSISIEPTEPPSPV